MPGIIKCAEGETSVRKKPKLHIMKLRLYIRFLHASRRDFIMI